MRLKIELVPDEDMCQVSCSVALGVGVNGEIKYAKTKDYYLSRLTFPVNLVSMLSVVDEGVERWM